LIWSIEVAKAFSLCSWEGQSLRASIFTAVQRLRFERPADLPRRKPPFDGHGVEWDTLTAFTAKEVTINDFAAPHSHRL
jgi:hypothetical protein